MQLAKTKQYIGKMLTPGTCLNKLFIIGSPALQRTPTKGTQQGNDSLHGASTNLVFIVPKFKNNLISWYFDLYIVAYEWILKRHF